MAQRRNGSGFKNVKDLSILICTLEDRRESRIPLFDKLASQEVKEMEILYNEDNGQKSIGAKRNELMAKAKGLFTVFIDDDDDVADNYVKLILDEVSMAIDCIGINGIMTTNGINPEQFFISIKHGWTKAQGVYFRYPNHISPIRRKHAQKVRFPLKNFAEDYEWATALVGHLKTEATIVQPIYFYKFRT